MTDEKFNPELCKERHGDLNRRVTTLEEILQKVQNRLPTWATIALTLLGSAVTGLLVALEKGH